MADRHSMTRDLRGRNRYTPSSAHDEAYRRSPAHDDMQMAVYRHLKNTPAAQQMSFNIGTGDKPDLIAAKAKWLNIERPFQELDRSGRPGRILGFADVVHTFVGHRPSPTSSNANWQNEYRRHMILELKPRIDSVGGIVRQCHVIDDLAERTMKPATGNYGLRVFWKIIVVVPYDDPSVNDLRAVCHEPIWLWNMEHGCPHGEEPE